MKRINDSTSDYAKGLRKIADSGTCFATRNSSLKKSVWKNGGRDGGRRFFISKYCKNT
jgi:hypothetical protein